LDKVLLRCTVRETSKRLCTLILQFPLRLDYGRSPHTYVNQRLQIELELLMMSGVLLETC
jgi:hypothetical protein